MTREELLSREGDKPFLREKMIVAVSQEVRERVTELFAPYDHHDDLGGACGVASYILFRTLNILGIKADFVMGDYDRDSLHAWPMENHCWIEFPDQDVLLDITATQFGEASHVLIARSNDSRYEEMHRNEEAFEHLHVWQGEQNPWVGYDNRVEETIEEIVGNWANFSEKRAA